MSAFSYVIRGSTLAEGRPDREMEVTWHSFRSAARHRWGPIVKKKLWIEYLESLSRRRLRFAAEAFTLLTDGRDPEVIGVMNRS